MPATASPIAIWSVVLLVGARPRGSASASTWLLSTTSASRASDDCGLPVTAIIGAPILLKYGMMSISS